MASDFWIHFNGRSGSSWLRALLDGSPAVTCIGEKFQKGQQKNADVQMSAIREYYLGDRPEGGVRGCKVKIGDIYEPAAHREFLETNGIESIGIRRKNPVHQSVSLFRARALNEQQGVWNRDASSPELGAIEIDPDEFAEAITMFGNLDRRLVKTLETFGDPLVIWYDDLVEDPLHELNRVRVQIGLEPIGALPETTIVKNTPSVRSAVANFDQLAERLADTPWLDMLDD